MLPDFKLSCSLFKDSGITLSRSQYEQFEAYAVFLVEYNKNVNLTAITEPMDILLKHFLDSVLVTSYIEMPEGATLIDVGTGGGFPGVPLKIVRPDLNVTLLDSLEKRVSFLHHLCDRLDINTDIIHGRAEDIGKMPEYREKFDFSVSRAVANMTMLSEYCLPLTRVGGSFAAMKGPAEVLDSAAEAVRLLGGEMTAIHNYTVGGELRRLAEVKKISHTPTKYPRNSSQMKKKPL